MLFLLIIRHIHCYKSTFLLGLLGFRLENTLERIMQRSPFILYSYYGTILIYIKLVMQIIDNQSFINGGGENKEIKTFILLFSFTENHYLCSVFLPSLT